MHRIQASPVGFHPELNEYKGFYLFFFKHKLLPTHWEKIQKKKVASFWKKILWLAITFFGDALKMQGPSTYTYLLHVS